MSLPDEIKERTGVISDLLAMVSWSIGPPYAAVFFNVFLQGRRVFSISQRQQGMTRSAARYHIEV
jgi:hypothetical protein